MAKGEDLQALARKKWQSSGLTDAQAKKLRFKVVTSVEVHKLGSHFLKAGALMMPYFTTKGLPTKFYRLRYLEAPTGSFAGQMKKSPRYAQPLNINEVYLPPLLKRTWAEIIDDVKETLYITEGELKSAAACSVGLACMGLGGVDVWRSQKRLLEALPILKEVEWDDRDVVIVYDSDASKNPNVVRAQNQLAGWLLTQGAKPRIASLPPAGELKQGLDDFLVANGPAALEKMLDEAVPTPEAVALWSLNEKVVYARNPGLVVELHTSRKIAVNDFTNHVYANHHYQQMVKGKEGAITFKPAKLAPRWVEWECRNEVKKITYAPGQGRITDDGCWNDWAGWGMEPLPSKTKDVKLWHELLDYICQDEDPAARRWFERWLAYPLQRPGTKLFTCVAIWGKQGTGKSLIGRTMMRIYGPNSMAVGAKHLRGSFNSWAENRQFILGDEITGSDKRADADELKNLITQHEMQINTKYVPEYYVPDCVNYYFTSNHPDAFFMDDDDRRNCIFHTAYDPLPDAFYKAYDKWMKGDGPSYLFDHLLHIDLGDFDPQARAIETNAKKRMIVTGKSDLGSFVLRLREDTAAALRPLGNEKRASECALFTSEELKRCYDPENATKVSVNGMAKELSRQGFVQAYGGNPINTANGRQRLFIVREQQKWMKSTPQDCAMHFNRYLNSKY